jgi:hypothetical protein
MAKRHRACPKGVVKSGPRKGRCKKVRRTRRRKGTLAGARRRRHRR